ncbi:glycosyltransferase family 2 protein, partial [Candidatus Roizmanbacteria bacterium]|nr:glycosyltransferase family 2 protein [Candidatus Roizmanbacteria bacterium]
YGVDHRWLKEHIDNRIPSEGDLEIIFNKLGINFFSIESNQIGDWQLMQMLIFAASSISDISQELSSINKWYNENTISLDANADVGYRKIYFLSRKKKNVEKVMKSYKGMNRGAKKSSLLSVSSDTFKHFTVTISNIMRRYMDMGLRYKELDNKYQDLVVRNMENLDRINKLETELLIIKDSRTWLVVNRIRKIFVFAKNTILTARNIVKKIKRRIKTLTSENRNSYKTWIKNVEPKLWTDISTDSSTKVSIVVPTYNTPDKYLEPLMKSILDQSYPNWQLCISDASTDIDRKKSIEKMSKKDQRICYVYNKGLRISENTNAAIDMAEGEYIGLLDHDDLLSPNAINEVVARIQHNPSVDIIYSDEDKISDDGKERQIPFFKPDWSPDLLNGVNYITHFLVVRSGLIKEVGGLRPRYDGAQDYDLLLRLTEKTVNIDHIPKILYHWRLADGSTSKSVAEKDYADDAGQDALRDAIRRRNIRAEVVEIPERPTNYRLRYELPDDTPLVSIIIPFKDKADLLARCVDSILSKTTYDKYEIILLSNNSEEINTKNLIKELKSNNKIKIFEWNHPFNFSKINNYGAKQSSGDYCLFLNNDTEVINPDWLSEMVGVAIQPGIGVVGPMLLYPDSKDGIQHAGVVLGMMTMAGHVFRHRKPDEWTDFGLPSWPRNYLALTGACMLVSKAIFNEAGRFDEDFTIAGSDVALCLRIFENGHRNVYWPFATLYHYESVSVGTYHNGIQMDYDKSLLYYKPYHINGDGYFNSNLDLMNEQVGVKEG